MNVTITNKEFRQFYTTLELLKRGLLVNEREVLFKGKAFYGVGINFKNLKTANETIVEEINRIMKAPNEELKTIQEKYARKNKDKKPVIKDGVYDIPEKNEKAFSDAQKALDKKYKKEIAERNEYLDTKEKFNIHVVSAEFMPDLPMYIADALMPMIKG